MRPGPKLRGFHYDSRSKRARFVVHRPGLADKRVQKTGVYPSRAAALSAWAEFRQQVLDGWAPLRGPVTVAAFLERHGESLEASLAPRTRAMQADILRLHVVPLLGHVRLDAVTLPALEDFVLQLRAKRLAAATINRILSVVRRILRDADRRNLIRTYPVKGDLPRQREEQLRLELSDAERARFLAAFDDEAGYRRRASRHQNAPKADGVPVGEWFERFRASRPVFVLALDTGLRRADLLGLRWESIDLAARTLTRRTEKTGAVVELPLTDAALAALETLKKRRNLKAPGLVMLDPDGRPYNVLAVRRYFDLAKALAGITRRLRLHDLRHTFASRLASRGVGVQTIAAALGHASYVTSQRYARPSKEAISSIRSALEFRHETATETATREG